MNKLKLSTLKSSIRKAEGIDEITKDVIIMLIERSSDMTKSCHVTMAKNSREKSYSCATIGYTASNLENRCEYLNSILKSFGSDLVISSKYGHFDEDGTFNSEGMSIDEGGRTMYRHPDEVPYRLTVFLTKKSDVLSAQASV